jgi:2-polyprenyl-6-methoxyphenol hydroxylase-like FAD-dependent oxidoreductase
MASRSSLKILVVGAGIAGSAASFMLARDGHRVRWVDSMSQHASGGYQIQIDVTAQRILDHMGVLEEVRALSAPAPRIVVQRRQRVLARIDPADYRCARRGDLVGTVSRSVAGRVPLELRTTVLGIEQTLAGARVRFDDGSTEDFDLVVGADGLGSTVRTLAVDIDGPSGFRTGHLTFWVDVDGRLAGTEEAAMLSDRGVGAEFFPYPDTEQMLLVMAVDTDGARRSVEELRPLAQRLLERSGPRYARFAEAVAQSPASGMRITPFAQVRAPRWHARSVVLVGDAAHCIDPLSGMGAHGGLLGAAVLADELRRRSGDVAAAAIHYQRRTERFTKPVQLLTAGLLELATAASPRDHATAAAAITGAAMHARSADVPALAPSS